MRPTKRNSAYLATVLACLAAGLAAPPAGASRGDEPVLVWESIRPIGDLPDDYGNPVPDDSGRYFPSVLTVRSNTYAVWSDNRLNDPYGESDPEVMLRVSPDDGRTWGPLRNISADALVGDDWGPAGLAATDTSVLVAFPTLTATAPNRFYPDATTLVRITGPNGDTVTRRRIPNQVFNSTLAGSGSNYYLVGDRNPFSSRLGVSRSTDDGLTFSDATTLFTDCRSEGASVAADHNLVVIAFVNPCSGTRGDVWKIVSTDAGVTWSTASAVTTAAQQEYAPSVHIEGGVATIAWQTVRSERGRTLDVSTSTTGGATWTVPVTVETHDTVQQDWSYDFSGPWTSPRFSGAGDTLTLYPPLSKNYLTSTDQGLTWQLAGTVPNSGQGIVYLHQGDQDLFAWKAQDTDAWVSTKVYRPAAPSNVSAELTGARTITVTWEPGNDADKVDRYVVYDQTGRKVTSVPPNRTSATIELASWGVPYTFTVTAENVAGTSDGGLSNTVTAASAPARPAKPVAAVSGRNVTLRWTAPDSHGSPVTGYVVTPSRGASKTVAGGVTKVLFKRLQPGTYTFQVTAANAVGASPASASVRVRIR